MEALVAWRQLLSEIGRQVEQHHDIVWQLFTKQLDYIAIAIENEEQREKLLNEQKERENAILMLHTMKKREDARNYFDFYTDQQCIFDLDLNSGDVDSRLTEVPTMIVENTIYLKETEPIPNVIDEDVEEIEEEEEDEEVEEDSGKRKRNYTAEENRCIVDLYNKYAYRRNSQGEIIFNSKGKAVFHPQRNKQVYEHFKAIPGFNREESGIKQQINKLRKMQKAGNDEFFNTNNINKILYL
jgi:hypothetical protein